LVARTIDEDAAMNLPTSSARRRRAALLLTGSLLIVPAAGAADAPTDPLFVQALEAYERNHWSAAFEAFAALADAGHAEAARVALQMLRFGPPLYGQRFEAPALRQQRWQATTGAARSMASMAP
jgi:hypothetical protein